MLQVPHFNLSVREVRVRTVQYRTAVLPYCYITGFICLHGQQRRPVVSRTPRHPASSPLPSSPLPSLDVVDRVYSQAFVVAGSTSTVLTIIPISALSVDLRFARATCSRCHLLSTCGTCMHLLSTCADLCMHGQRAYAN